MPGCLILVHAPQSCAAHAPVLFQIAMHPVRGAVRQGCRNPDHVDMMIALQCEGFVDGPWWCQLIRVRCDRPRLLLNGVVLDVEEERTDGGGDEAEDG